MNRSSGELIGQLRKVWFQVGVALLANIITWLVIYTKIRPSSEVIPLHYGIFYGADLVGKGYYLYVIPFAGLVILAINYYFYTYIQEREPLAAKILIAIALILQVLLLIAILFLKSIIAV